MTWSHDNVWPVDQHITGFGEEAFYTNKDRNGMKPDLFIFNLGKYRREMGKIKMKDKKRHGKTKVDEKKKKNVHSRGTKHVWGQRGIQTQVVSCKRIKGITQFGTSSRREQLSPRLVLIEQYISYFTPYFTRGAGKY